MWKRFILKFVTRVGGEKAMFGQFYVFQNKKHVKTHLGIKKILFSVLFF